MKFQLVLSAAGVGFTNSVAKAVRGVNAFHKEMDAARAAAARLDRGLAGAATKITALFGGISTGVLVKSLFNAGVASEKLDKAFKGITGSSAAAQKEIEFVRNTSDKLGLEFLSTADSYKILAAASKGTELEGQKTRDLFVSITEAGTVLGASNDQLSRTFLQIGQGIGRTRFELEDLKTISEALPGVGMKDFADALGVTTQQFLKMVSAGEVVSNDFLPKLTQALHEKFGKAALDAANSAEAAVNRFKNAWFDLKTTLSDAGFMDIATGRIKELANAMKDPEVKQRAAEVANNFFKMADAVLRFAVNHGAAAAKITGTFVALSVLSRTVYMLTGLWKGLNVIMLATTGTRLIPYLATLRQNLALTEIAALGVRGALGAAAGSFLALVGGINIGEWIYKQTEVAERELRELQHQLDLTAAKFRQFAGFQTENKKSLFEKSTEDLKEYEQRLIGAFKYQSAIVQNLYAQSRETKFWGGFTDEAKRAQVELVAARERLKSIERAMNDYAEVVKQKQREIAAAEKQTGNKRETISQETLDKMKGQYKKYVDEIKRLQDEIADKERSLQEELRDMARSGMSDLQAWKNRKAEADEYYAAAERAAKAGDFKTATDYINMASRAYKDLNEEVKVNNTELIKLKQQQAAAIRDSGWTKGTYQEYLTLNKQIQQLQAELQQKGGDAQRTAISANQALQTSTEGVKKSGELAIEILKKQEEATKEAADALNEESGWQVAAEGLTKAGEEARQLAEASQQFDEEWKTAIINMGVEFAKELDALERNINHTLRPRKLLIETETREKHAAGGMVGRFAGGGHLPGYGGGDKIRALLEAGEFVVRKEAVSKYGAGFFHALNSMRIDGLSMIKARIGGLIESAGRVSVQRFQQGGLATSPGQATGETITVNLNLPTSGRPLTMRARREEARELLRQVGDLANNAS